ncbi:MAG: hypothetical protein JWM56_674 [Candidatus Peribacteria bacterium]|nr:hypothetical protein [Candidatus Peribacteria bacterium]
MRYTALLIFWLISDAVVFVAAYVLAYFIRVGWILSSDFPLMPHLSVALLTVPFWLIVLITTRSFSITRRQAGIRSIAYIVYACLVGTALFALTYYFLFGLFFSRLLLFQALLISSVLTIAWHIAYEQILRSVLWKDPAQFPTLIVGVTRESTKLIELLYAKKNPLKPVAILDGTGAKEKDICGVPVLGKLNKLEETLDTYKITHLIQCSDMEHTINLISVCKNRNINYLVLPSVFGIVEGNETLETLEGRGVTMVSPKQSNMLRWFFQ